MKKMPELNYQSFLADAMRDYLDYLDHLGFTLAAPAYNLRVIDRFLVRNHITSIHQCDTRFWLRLVAQHQSRVRAKTLLNWRCTFSGFCRYLVRAGWMPQNPVAAFSTPKLEHYRPYVFSTEELRRFFDWLKRQADGVGDPFTSFRFRSLYVFYHLIYACGLRVSEAVRITAGDYSAEQCTLFIQPSKFLKDRLIPIGERVASNLSLLLELRQHRFGIPAEGPVFLFLHERRPYTKNWASLQFRSALRHLGIYRAKVVRQGCTYGTPHLHELRRAFAVHRLIRWYREHADVDAKLPLLATYMGHVCFKYTKTYLTLTQQLLFEAGHRFAGSFDHLDWMTHDPEL